MEMTLNIEQYKILLEQTGVGYWEARFHQRIFYGSEYLSHILGLESQQLTFLDFQKLIHPDFQCRVADEFRRIEDLGWYDQAFPVLTHKGIKWMRSKCCIVDKGADGDIIAIGTMQPIFDQDLDVLEFEPFLSQICRFAKIGYAKYNLSTGEGLALDQWYLNLGEVPGTPLNQIIGIYSNVHPEDLENLMDSLGRIIRKEIDYYQGDIRIKNGERWNWIRQNMMVTRLEKSGHIVLILVSYDISELKVAEERKENAERLDHLKSIFLSNISHEIRMPLNAIVGFSSLLGDEEDHETRQDYINIIQANDELLLGIVNNILDLAKIESDTMDFNFSEFDLKQLIVETVSSFRINMPEGVALIYPESLESFRFRCDRVRLKQVLGNFITNAIKYTSVGSITLFYETIGNEVLLSVTDTGEGMSEEVMLHVFDRFYKGQKQGTGLGLSICRNIIERLGGRIGVSSEQGKGSCFWCALPIFPRKYVN